MPLYLNTILPYIVGIVVLLVLLFSYKLILQLFGIIIIPESTIGVVNKKFVIFGKNKTLPDGCIIALNGEAGWQAQTLAPGLHFWLWPWQYQIDKQEFVQIPDGMLGLVEALDGKPLLEGRVLGRHVDCSSFQDAVAFLKNGGERGPQISIIPPGVWRINTALFELKQSPVTEIDSNSLGVVTTKEGAPLPAGEIAASEVIGHNSFQNGQAFLEAKGFKGRQEQVILAGKYFLNPLFAEVETKPLTEVPIAHVGVVIAYVGKAGQDVTGDEFRHGNLVRRGEKGVWVDPYDPGKYPINPYTHKVEIVPTANVVLNWATGKNEAHKLDTNLSTITVRSSDGFKFNLDVSQIIHVPRNDAPKVIARFGSMLNLVTQVLEPTIGNYFRNSAQSHDVISFLKERMERQAEARNSISTALKEYNVGAIDTLIGDIVPPEELMKTLTDRKIAEQEQITYMTQKTAEETRKELQQAKAIADTQSRVVDAERKVSIAEFEATAKIASANGEAQSKMKIADADAAVTRVTGSADAEKTLKVGTAEADVIKMKITSMEAGNYAAIEVSRYLSQAKVPIVPDIVAGGNNNGTGSGSGLVDVLLGSLLRDQIRNGHEKKEKNVVETVK